MPSEAAQLRIDELIGTITSLSEPADPRVSPDGRHVASPTFEATLAGSRPWDGPDARQGNLRSPIAYARNVRTPLLILHGKNDERIPVGQAIGFERALRDNGVPVELVTYPREPHGVRERAH